MPSSALNAFAQFRQQFARLRDLVPAYMNHPGQARHFPLFEIEQPSLHLQAVGRGIPTQRSPRADDSVTGNDQWEPVGRHDLPYRACCPGMASDLGQFRVRSCLADRDSSACPDDSFLKWRIAGQIEFEVQKVIGR
jgi:hypothetical protein